MACAAGDRVAARVLKFEMVIGYPQQKMGTRLALELHSPGRAWCWTGELQRPVSVLREPRGELLVRVRPEPSLVL